MKVVPYLEAIVSQAEFAQIIGVSEARVSQLMSESILTRGETCAEWLIGYCERLRDQAAGRAGETFGLDLVQERAALARTQREGLEIKNAVARGEYAPIGALADVLGAASSAVVDRMNQVEGQLRKVCPDLPESARVAVLKLMADARNEWMRATEKVVVDHLATMQAAEDEADSDLQEGGAL